MDPPSKARANPARAVAAAQEQEAVVAEEEEEDAARAGRARTGPR